jgi:hypothetical protein
VDTLTRQTSRTPEHIRCATAKWKLQIPTGKLYFIVLYYSIPLVLLPLLFSFISSLHFPFLYYVFTSFIYLLTYLLTGDKFLKVIIAAPAFITILFTVMPSLI